MSKATRCDVIVLGGGPAGSTAAALLARAGRRVVLLEKDRHPRFHIGESLLPMNLPIFARLGVLEQVAAIGVEKPGADFADATDAGHTTYAFARALRGEYRYAFQVKRAELDQLLFQNAARAGADAREGVTARDVQLDDSEVRVTVRGESGEDQTLSARYLIDASGRDTFLGNKLRLKENHPSHRSAALFAHFSGVARRQGDEAGNISIVRFDDGWVWLIPLREDITSIGAVCRPERLEGVRGRETEALAELLAGLPAVARRLASASQVGPARLTGNYSYRSRAMTGPRWLMVGDAHAFIDPVFSSGVYLAMRSAERAAELVHDVLHRPEREAALQAAYAKEVNKGLEEFSWFICRFMEPTMGRLFARPNNLLKMEQAVTSLLSGDVFEPGLVRLRLLAFKAVYGASRRRDGASP